MENFGNFIPKIFEAELLFINMYLPYQNYYSFEKKYLILLSWVELPKIFHFSYFVLFE